MQKKFYLLFFFSLTVIISRAQITKDAILLGGNVGYSYSSQTADPGSSNNNYLLTKQTSLSLSPSIAKAIEDNFLMGIDLSYAGQRTNETNEAQPNTFVSKSDSYGIGFYLRRYKYLGSQFSIFLQSRLGGTYDKTSYNYTNPPSPYSSSKGYSLSLGFYSGISYLISKRIMLETGFQNIAYANFSHAKTTQVDSNNTPGTYKTNNFTLGSGLSNSYLNFVVGIQFLLNNG